MQRAAKRSRKQDVFTYSTPYQDNSGRSIFESEEQLDQALSEIASEEFGGNSFNGLNWIKKRVEHRKRNNDTRRLYYCTYHYNSKCQWRVAVITNHDGKSHILKPSPDLVQHSDHGKTYQKSGIPKQVNAIIASRTQLKQMPKQFVRQVREKGIPVDRKMAKSMTRKFMQLRKDHLTQHITTSGDALPQIQQHRRSSISKNAIKDKVISQNKEEKKQNFNNDTNNMIRNNDSIVTSMKSSTQEPVKTITTKDTISNNDHKADKSSAVLCSDESSLIPEILEYKMEGMEYATI